MIFITIAMIVILGIIVMLVILWFILVMIVASVRKGGWYGWKPSSSSNISLRAFLRAQIYQFEPFELVLLLKLGRPFPVEQFEATVSQSTIPSLLPLLSVRPICVDNDNNDSSSNSNTTSSSISISISIIIIISSSSTTTTSTSNHLSKACEGDGQSTY